MRPGWWHKHGGNGPGITLIRRMYHSRDNRPGCPIHHVLRLAGHMRAAILEPDYAGLLIRAGLPVLVRERLSRAPAGRGDKFGQGRRLYAAGFGRMLGYL